MNPIYDRALSGHFSPELKKKRLAGASYCLFDAVRHGSDQQAVRAVRAALTGGALSAQIDPYRRSLNPSDLTFSLGPHGLSIAHLAVIRGGRRLIRVLTDSGLFPKDLKDAQGWTPSHHAALLTDKATYETLKEKGLVSSEKNRYGGDPADLLSLSQKPNPADDDPTIDIFDRTTGAIRTLTQKEFRRISGDAIFTRTIYTPPEALLDKWFDLTPDSPTAQNASQEAEKHGVLKDLERRLKLPAKLYITNHHKLDDETTTSKFGWALYAGQQFAPTNVITLYEGKEVLPSSVSCFDYQLDFVDAKEFRGYGAYASDGFPNAQFYKLYNVFGRKQASAIVAIQPIKPGELVVVDYVTHTIKSRDHQEVRPRAFEEYFAKNSVSSLFKRLNNTFPDVFSYPLSAITYIATTPMALYTLYFSGKLTLNDVQIMAWSEYMNSYQFGKQREYYIEVIRTIESFDPTIQEVMKGFFREKVKTANTFIFANAMMDFTRMPWMFVGPTEQVRSLLEIWYDSAEESLAKELERLSQ